MFAIQVSVELQHDAISKNMRSVSFDEKWTKDSFRYTILNTN